MRGTLSTAGVHDLVHGNRPKFVAMAVKKPESPCDIGMNDWIMTDSEEERVLTRGVTFVWVVTMA